MKRRPDEKYKKYWYAGITGFIVLAAVGIVWNALGNIGILWDGLGAVYKALAPVLIGMIIAYLFSPLVDKMDRYIFIPLMSKIIKKKNRAKNAARGLSVTAIIILTVLAFFCLVMMVVPELVNSISGLSESLPEYYTGLREWGDNVFKAHPKIDAYFKQWSSTIFDSIISWLKNDVLPVTTIINNVTDGMLSAVGVVTDLFIGLILSIYFMSSKEYFCALGKRLLYTVLTRERANTILSVFGETHNMFGKFISGKLIDSLVVGIVTFIMLSIADIPYTVLISVVIGVTNIIPFFGPYIGTIPSALLVFIASPNKVVIFLVLVVIMMQVDGNVISPKIIGDSIGLGSFWILFSILFFGSLFGLIGMICAVPLFAVVYRMVKNWSAGRLAKKSLPTETDYYAEIKQLADDREGDGI